MGHLLVDFYRSGKQSFPDVIADGGGGNTALFRYVADFYVHVLQVNIEVIL
jgi:hypothetical protein